MKISCQSCQAKYTIADEKVLGKIVKIRCKKCGATIVINGNEGAAAVAGEGPASAGVYDASAGDAWTVNVADGDQRTMSTQEIADAFHQGVVTEETFCWKDGMGDWLPLREIEQLAAACGVGAGGGAAASPDQTQEEHQQPPAMGMGMGGGYEAPPPSAPTQAQDQGGFGGFGAGLAAAPPPNGNGNGMNGGLFGSSPPPAAARRQGGRGGAGADLFGAVAQAGGEDEVMTSAPAPGTAAEVGDGKLTGQRNENSVLFSLNALTSSGPKEEAPAAAGEGSGLIDIRALSASMSNDGSGKKNHVDDIMNLGGGGAFSAALAAPVLSPSSMDNSDLHQMGGARKDNTKLILIGIIAAGALIALSIVLVFVLKKPAEPQVTAPVGTMPAPTDTASAAPAQPTASATVATNDTPAAPANAAAPGTGQAASPARKPSGGGGGGGGGGGAPKPYVPPAPSPAAGGGGGGGNFDDAIKKAVGAPAAPPPQAAAQSSAPFDRGAAAAALGSVNVASCKKGDGPTGSGHVSITFAPSGNVQSAVVDQPPFAGTSVGGCVAGKFRGAHIPAFAGSPVKVGKSFVVE